MDADPVPGGLSAGQLLAPLEDKPGRVMVVDLGGGVMTVARGDESQVDALVVVVEPYPRSLEVGRRVLEMATAKNISRRIVVANKVGGGEDIHLIGQFLGAEPDDLACCGGAAAVGLVTRGPIRMRRWIRNRGRR